MKLRHFFLFALTGIIFLAAEIFAAGISSTNDAVTTQPVYVPDTSQANGPLSDGVIAWDSAAQATNAAADQDQAHFTFSFTNVSGGNVVILNVHPSCGCTTAQLPPVPWMIPPAASEQIPVTINIAGKTGTLIKSINISTDKGSKDLYLRITILPPVIPTMNDADRARGVAAAKIDRQAVFQNDCATCHVKPGEGKYGKALYDAVCAVCHEASNRATMVPDLHALKIYTNDEFWRTWVAHGKAGSFMPAFSTAEGGPLSDMQIASLAAYLDQTIPSLVPQPAVQ
jgi:mono/diheme cytochrome c family protein